MKKIIITLSIVLGFIISYGQVPDIKEIDKIVLDTWKPEIGQTQSYTIFDTNNVVNLKLDSISYYPNGFISKVYFSAIEDFKTGFILKKKIVKKNTIFVLNGGDATVMIHKTYLHNLGIKKLKPFINIKNKIVEYKTRG
jgi:hypothetical protein